MAFYSKSFIYDGVQSELYDLRIFEFNPSSPIASPVGGEVEIQEQWLYRRAKPYFYGRYYQSPLEFDFTVGSFSYIDGNTRNAIESWLLGKSNYAQLRIVQADISEIVFNVIITRSAHVYVGNLAYGINLHARCDSPFSYYYPPITTKTYSSGSGLASETFDYFNDSVINGYNKPTVTFTMNTAGSSTNYFSIINTTDGNREFRFDNLSPLETITVNNDLGIITSSASALRLGNFNKKFFRLLQGNNSLVLSGNITSFTISAEFPRGVGA